MGISSIFNRPSPTTERSLDSGVAQSHEASKSKTTPATAVMESVIFPGQTTLVRGNPADLAKAYEQYRRLQGGGRV